MFKCLPTEATESRSMQQEKHLSATGKSPIQRERGACSLESREQVRKDTQKRKAQRHQTTGSQCHSLGARRLRKSRISEGTGQKGQSCGSLSRPSAAGLSCGGSRWFPTGSKVCPGLLVGEMRVPNQGQKQRLRAVMASAPLTIGMESALPPEYQRGQRARLRPLHCCDFRSTQSWREKNAQSRGGGRQTSYRNPFGTTLCLHRVVLPQAVLGHMHSLEAEPTVREQKRS